MNVEADLVDQISFEQRLREHSTTKHANVFTFLCFNRRTKSAASSVTKVKFLLLRFLIVREKT